MSEKNSWSDEEVEALRAEIRQLKAPAEPELEEHKGEAETPAEDAPAPAEQDEHAGEASESESEEPEEKPDETAQLTEARDKALAELEETRAELDKARQQIIKLTALAEAGLPYSLASIVPNGTEEEIQTGLAALIAWRDEEAGKAPVKPSPMNPLQNRANSPAVTKDMAGRELLDALREQRR